MTISASRLLRPAAIASAFLLSLAAFPAPRLQAIGRQTPLLREPPKNWHLLDDSADHVLGISAERAYAGLLAGKSPARTIVVAVIDGGVDTGHAVFRGVLWTNAKEVAGNGKDDDRNGYVDDIHGWNYMGSADGRSYVKDLSEEQRVLTTCRRNAALGLPEVRPATALHGCAEMLNSFNAQRDTLMFFGNWLRATQDTLLRATKTLRAAAGTDSLNEQLVRNLKSDKPDVLAAQKWWLSLGVFESPEPMIAHDIETLTEQLKAFEQIPDPRPLVGDHYDVLDEKGYGNSDVRGPDPSHGTAVASVIAGLPDSGTVGVARSHVQIMSLRTVPSGDERDKDVANAIRYAADNGAQIINMSFGKHISPGKSAVDAAVAYAEKKGVLMIHAAGNDGAGIATPGEPYPNPQYLKGGNPAGWLEVGASSWQPGEGMAAIFSNYGKERVDLFAPGEDLYMATPGGGFERASGTSFAAPVVSGVAAVLMSYYPKLTALDVKRILLASAVRVNRVVIRPGSTPDSVANLPFSELSKTGAVVNLYTALKLAAAEKK